MARGGRPPKNTKIFNQDLKNRFIEEEYSNVDTQKRYRKLFVRTYEFEEQLSKDIYNFTLDELKDMIISLSSVSTATLNSTISILRKYVNWVIKQEYIDSKINIVDYINTDEIKNMISHVAQEYRYLKSKDDLVNIINSTKNAQDAVIFVLAFHGLKADDILNVTIDDVEGNTVKAGNRTIELEDRFIDVIHEAYNQTIYTKNNGVVSAGLRSPEIPLDTDSRNIIHGTVNKGRKATNLTKQVLNNRVKRVIESFGITGQKELYTKLLTLVNVFYSGMFITLHEIEQTRPLTNEDYIEIRERYGLEPRNFNDTMDRYAMWKRNL